jgi:MoxR-like ATPase
MEVKGVRSVASGKPERRQMTKTLTDTELEQIRLKLEQANPNQKIRAWQIAGEVKTQYNIQLDESTIRGRFIQMGKPLSGGFVAETKPPEPEEPKSVRRRMQEVVAVKQYTIPDEFKQFIPQAGRFDCYIERDVDKRLAVHYNSGKYPITQGKQGTGKTFGHEYYAFKYQMPFFLYSCYEDFKLSKMYGDKTIMNGSIKFKESLFVRTSQIPSVHLFDEVNAISNANTYDFHALLQNRELFIRDADDGNGKIYKLHPDCRIGFAQNPKSAKYIGGNIKQSNFLGRCTFITYPEFTKKEISGAIKKKFTQLTDQDTDNFTKYYFAIIETIEKANIPVDISIRQLNNVVDLWLHGLPLRHAIEDGLASILEAISQPKAKESFMRIAEAVWKELMEG